MQSSMRQLLANDGPIVATIRAHLPNAIAAYAFGSRMQGTAGPESDLDLAVLVAGYAAPLALWDTAGSLADDVLLNKAGGHFERVARLADALKRRVAFRKLAK